MTAIRRRLAFWYTVALGLTMLAFGAALYYERRQSSVEELDRRLALEADLAQRWLVESYRVLGPLGARPARVPPSIRGSAPTSKRSATTSSWWTPAGNVHRRCPASPGRSAAAEFQRLARAAVPAAGPERRPGRSTSRPRSAPVRYLRRPDEHDRDRRRRAAGGARPRRTWRSVRAELLRSMLVIAPVMLLCAAALGWWLAGTSSSPCSASSTSWRRSPTGGACTAGSRCRSPATRSAGSW